MKHLLLFLFVSLHIVLAGQKSPSPPGTVTYKIITSVNNTWGYDIYNAGRLMVHQPHVPGQSGNQGFSTKAAAESVAKLVVSKIEKGEMPPTVTTEELKKLKAI